MQTRMNLVLWGLALVCMASALLVPWTAEHSGLRYAGGPLRADHPGPHHRPAQALQNSGARGPAPAGPSAAREPANPLSPESRRMILFGLWLVVAAWAAILSHRALSLWEKGKAPSLGAGQEEAPAAGEQGGYFFRA